MVKTLAIQARTHGRALVREATRPHGFLLGFHGYAENAEIQMARLESIPGTDTWTLVSVQGLHRFYSGRSQDVVAGWMTRQDRETAIDDNIDYVNRVLGSIAETNARIVFAGFSQGVAMAFRAAVRGSHPAAGVVSVGGDVPPELLAEPSLRLPSRILLARGAQDDWYTDPKLQADIAALTARGTAPAVLVHTGGHEWTVEVSTAAGTLLENCR